MNSTFLQSVADDLGPTGFTEKAYATSRTAADGAVGTYAVSDSAAALAPVSCEPGGVRRVERSTRCIGVAMRRNRRAADALIRILLVSALAACSVSYGATAPSPPIFLADRLGTWNPGVPGGVPARSRVCANVSAATYGNGVRDATAGIQAAIAACPPGEIVLLSAGTFTINSGNFLLIDKGITLRGAGPGLTTLQKTDGARPGVAATGPKPSPIVILGPTRWAKNGGFAGSTNLSADAAKGAYSITVASPSGFKAGQTVLLDELSGAAWQTDPCGRGQIWAAPDFRVAWQLHDPRQPTDDSLRIPASAASQDAFGWFSRLDRPTAEIKQIASVARNVITFSTPVHISYRTSHTAQLSSYNMARTANAGIESLAVIGGDNGNVRFQWCDGCWAKSIDNSAWHDEGFAVDSSFRVEIRDSYVHDAAWAQPGGGGYAISLSHASSEVLVENAIIVKANKMMVARSAGAGSVFGYNYVDDGYINTNAAWIEVGLNGSHMVGSHHMLFEGNYAFNYDSDKTHGNAIYHTIFRNYLPGIRAPFNSQLGGTLVDDASQPTNGPRRAAGAAAYSYWHTFVGNVLGIPGKMNGWVYQATSGILMDSPTIWLLGWDDWSPYPIDPNVAATTVRHGNYDYVTNSVVWDPNIADHTLPASLYLTQKPAFFNAGKGYTWPWVDPVGSTQVYVLPAKARYDAGTPFVQP
jgi:Pectate lyase superfamily protein